MVTIRWFGRSSGGEDASRESAAPVDLFSGLDEREDPLAFWIKGMVPDAPQARRREETVASLLVGRSASEIRQLDYSMRWRPSWYWAPWDRMERDDAAILLGQSADLVTTAIGLSMHRNGHVRQLAVQALAATHDERAIPWLLLRSGDWVDQVSNAAGAGLEAFVGIGHVEALVGILPLLDGDRFRRGSVAEGVRKRVEQVLTQPEAIPALRVGLRSSERKIRRAAVRLLVRADSGIDLLREAIATNDVVVIGLVAASIPMDGPLNLETGHLLHDSPLGRFRSEGLWRLTRGDGTARAQALVVDGLFDPAASVRDVAQRWMKAYRPDISVGDIYRTNVALRPLPALRGLGDTTEERDVEVATEHLRHQAPSVRVAALRLLARLGRSANRDLFIDRFVNGSGKERREALLGLRRAGGSTITSDLWRMALDSGDVAVCRRVLLQLVPIADRWQRLSIGLQAAALSDRELFTAGLDVLDRTFVAWNSQHHIRQTVESEVLRRHLDAARPALNAAEHDRWRRNHSRVSVIENLVPGTTP